MFDAIPLLIFEDDSTLVVTIDNPVSRNAITRPMLALLEEVLRVFCESPHLKVMLIRACGSHFCSGFDLSAGSISGYDSEAIVKENYDRQCADRNALARICTMLRQAAKPIVVAHQGACVGAGIELSLACDFRLAARSASYLFSEIQPEKDTIPIEFRRVGRLMGTHSLHDVAMASMPVDAERALAMGLVHKVFVDEIFDHGVITFCHQLACAHDERKSSVS